MAKRSTADSETVIVSFKKRQHFWFDAGLVGLSLIAEGTHGVASRKVQLMHDARSLRFTGKAQEIKSALEEAYDILVERHYNVSTEKQRNEKAGYYFDSKSNSIVRFAKREAQGIVLLIFNKAVRPSVDQIPWKELAKRNPAAHKIVSRFLEEQKLKQAPRAGLLLDGPNRLKPAQVISIPEGKKSGTCFLCGETSSSLKEVDQLVYPMITGTSGILSFNSEGSKKPPRICWKCSYLSKFVPASGFYLRSNGRLHCFFPYSSDLRVMLDAHHLIHDIEEEDPNYFRNFSAVPSGYLHHANEVAFSFLFTLYEKARTRQAAEMTAREDPDLTGFFPLEDFLSGSAPLEFYRLHAELMGQTVRVKRIAKFYDAATWFRFFRKFDPIGSRDQEISENGSVGLERGLMEKLYWQLLDKDAKREAASLTRDRFLGRVLEKRTVLDLAESHAYHVNRGTKPVNISAIAKFVLLYEPMVRKEQSMTETERQAAVSLGKRIGSVVAAEKDGRKGDLFSLRKARTVADFLAELNRLQFRYPLAVPPETYEGALRQDTFEEFRGFCMVAALNTFNAKKTSKNDEKKEQS